MTRFLLLFALLAWPARPAAASSFRALSQFLFLPVIGNQDLLDVGLWTGSGDLSQLPTSGSAWSSLLSAANKTLGTPDISNQDDDTDVYVLAKALVYARTGQPTYRLQVIDACMQAIGTEVGGRTLALGRNLVSYVLAADLVGLPPADDQVFKAWLKVCLTEVLDGKTLISTHEKRPNNWGTHAGASRAAVAAYLGDSKELARCAKVFRGWLGDRDSYAGFEYGDLDWQADPDKPVGINPLGSTKQGHDIDGVLPDDQRRSGPFTWPPPKENYVWEALQGAVVQAMILHRAGYNTWQWEDQALLRALVWLHEQCNYPAEGDDTWQPHLINAVYGADFPAPVPSKKGKNMGWTDWSHSLYECQPDLGSKGPGSADLTLCGTGLSSGQASMLQLSQAPANVPCLVLVSAPGQASATFAGGTLVSATALSNVPLLLTTNEYGECSLPVYGVSGATSLVVQCVIWDVSLAQGYSISNAVLAELGQ